MIEAEIQLRTSKLLALVARHEGWEITEETAREYVLLEAKVDRSEAEEKRKREIITHCTGNKCECKTCQHGHTGKDD